MTPQRRINQFLPTTQSRDNPPSLLLHRVLEKNSKEEFQVVCALCSQARSFLPSEQKRNPDTPRLFRTPFLLRKKMSQKEFAQDARPMFPGMSFFYLQNPKRDSIIPRGTSTRNALSGTPFPNARMLPVVFPLRGPGKPPGEEIPEKWGKKKLPSPVRPPNVGKNCRKITKNAKVLGQTLPF